MCGRVEVVKGSFCGVCINSGEYRSIGGLLGFGWIGWENCGIYFVDLLYWGAIW